MKKIFVVLVAVFLVSCARAPLTDPAKAFRLSSPPEQLEDSFPIETLREALQRTLAAYKSSSTIPNQFVFGELVVGREEYRKSLELLESEMVSFDRFHAFVHQHFDFYEVYGNEDWGQAFSTGYYDPWMKGSLKRTEKFSEPLYRTPPDLVVVDIGAYHERFPEMESLRDLLTEQKSNTPALRGRIDRSGKLPKVVPYYRRSEIQRDRPLAGKGLEIVWVDPIDAFFLEIQGSGIVELPNGKLVRVGYDSQNGWKYEAIGKYLKDFIPIEQMSMQRIRNHLESLPREQQQSVFDQNPSYVFFQELKGHSLTYSGAEVTPGRTIATDQFLFPKGLLAFLDIETPVFSDDVSLDPSSWERRPRWVFDQDTGGAIRGGGRLDLYFGKGAEAERAAGVMKRSGKLWYLAPKSSFLEKLRLSVANL